MLLDETRQFLVSYGAYLRDLTKAYMPDIIGSLFIVLLFWVLAFVIRLIIVRGFRGLDRVAEYRGAKGATPRKHTVSKVIGDVVFWLLIIFGLILAAQNLGLSLLIKVLNYLPNIILAGIIIFIGYVLGNLFYDILQNSLANIERKRAIAIAQLAKWLTIIFFIVLGVDQLQINITLLSSFTVIGFAAIVFSLGLVFSLSFNETLKNILACQQIQRQIEVGRTININEMQGKIIDFTQTHVLLEMEEGVVHIPAHLFQQKTVKLFTAYK